MKTCGKCKEAKPETEFYSSAYRFDGLQWSCKDCDKARRRAVYVANPAACVARVQKWKWENIEVTRANNRDSKRRCKERLAAQMMQAAE